MEEMLKGFTWLTRGKWRREVKGFYLTHRRRQKNDM